jgi:hypothetical protein
MVVFCRLIFRICFLGNSYIYVGQRLLLRPWSTITAKPFWRSARFRRGTALRLWPLKGFGRGFSLLGRAFIPWLLNAPSSCFACPCSCLFQSPSSADRQSLPRQTESTYSRGKVSQVFSYCRCARTASSLQWYV